jgi:putative mRNA 3-end processing factor
MSDPLIQSTERGLYCPAGDFFIDPWQPVDRAVITHGHADHLVAGCGNYLISSTGATVIHARLGNEAPVATLPYREAIDHHGVRITFFPAGHVLGSAQVRLEHGGDTWVVSGDYKTAADPTCTPFEPVGCRVFLTESTFGLPIYRWPSAAEVFGEIDAWWRGNQEQGKASLLYGYALGKAQRVLAGIDATIGPIFTHGAVERINEAYRAAGVRLPPTTRAVAADPDTDWSKTLIVAPPSAHGTPWTRRFGPLSTALASGWMTIRGTRRRRSIDRGFVLSDHVDWPGLNRAIAVTGAEKVLVTHGHVGPMVRWLREQGLDAEGIQTRYEDQLEEAVGRAEEQP